MTAPTARYPYECTLHQGEIENLFLDSMSKHDLQVDRPVVPISLQLSEDQKELANPHAYPVKVRTFSDLLSVSSPERTHVRAPTGRAEAPK